MKIQNYWQKVDFTLARRDCRQLISGTALPSKPLVSIALSDADPRSSISFVKQKLKDADVLVDFTAEQTAYVERLGGRASDLESVSCFDSDSADINSLNHAF